MARPGSLSPKHPEYKSRLAHLRTAGRWVHHATSVPDRKGMLVQLWSQSGAVSLTMPELANVHRDLEQAVKKIQSTKAWVKVTGGPFIGALNGKTMISLAFLTDEDDMRLVEKALASTQWTLR